MTNIALLKIYKQEMYIYTRSDNMKIRCFITLINNISYLFVIQNRSRLPF